MIQPAATSVSSGLALTNGSQAAQADDAPVSADFASLLGPNGSTAAGQPGDTASTGAAAADPARRQAAGNASGTKLPVGLPDADAILATADEPADTGLADAAGTDASLTTRTTEIILPGLVLPVTSSLPQAAKSASPALQARPSTTESLAKAAQAALDAPAGSSAKPRKRAATGTSQDKKADREDTTGKSAASPAPTTAALTPVVPVVVAAPPSAVAQFKADGATPSASAPPTPPPGTPARGAPAQPGSPIVADGQRTQLPLVAGPQATGPATSQAPAAVIRATLARPAAAGDAVDAPATPQVQIIVDTQSQRPGAALDAQAQHATPAAGSTKGTDAATAQPQAPIAADLQPVLAMAHTQPADQTVAPVTATTATAPLHPTGHDFTTLVDRLVEAREAALPQAVHAAVAHSEFGQVSLRFEHDGSGLSVAMSSADPDFARAVQASASAAQAQTSNDNGSAAPRQDAQHQQQSAGSPSGQPQSQSQSQAFGREGRSSQVHTAARSDTAGSGQTEDGEPADTRSGIYA